MKVLTISLLFVSLLYSDHHQAPNRIDVQGHRGCRGLRPENTIPAFLKAVNIGATTLEMDVVISKDSQVVVSHEPWFSPDYCLDPRGKKIKKGKEGNFYQMNYEEIKTFECGKKGNKEFPSQLKTKAYKPLLKEVITEVENYCSANEFALPFYSIEIKSRPTTDNIYHPAPEVFAERVLKVIIEYGIEDRVTIQSFDPRPLIYIRENFPEIKLSMLSAPETLPDSMFLAILGFTPEIYSPQFEQLTPQKVLEMQKMGMKVIPWTVNKEEDMVRLISWKVDGIITDYPDRLLDLLEKEKDKLNK